jgi:hypothetical protein
MDAKEGMKGSSVKRSCPFFTDFFSFFKWELNTQRRVALPTKKHSVQQPREEDEKKSSLSLFFLSLKKKQNQENDEKGAALTPHISVL